MVDVGRITHPTGSGVLDPVTGVLTRSGTTVHEGPCRLRWPNAAEQELVVGDEVVTRQRCTIDFPHDVTAGRIGDVITIVKSIDDRARARTFRITAETSKTYLLYRQYACEAIE